ncbi:hypothetical protein M2144_002749, partial [Lachnospiraceae bacterium PFB1-22]
SIFLSINKYTLELLTTSVSFKLIDTEHFRKRHRLRV